MQMRDFTESRETHDRLLEVYREYNHAMHDEAVRTFPSVIEGLNPGMRTVPRNHQGPDLESSAPGPFGFSRAHRLLWQGRPLKGANHSGRSQARPLVASSKSQAK